MLYYCFTVFFIGQKQICVTVWFLDIEKDLVSLWNLWAVGNADTSINEKMFYWNTNKTILCSNLE